MEDVAHVAELTMKQLRRLDILVNNVAGNFLSSIEDLSLNGFQTVMDIDSVGTFTMYNATLRHLKKGGHGKTPSEASVMLNISAVLHYTTTWYQIHIFRANAVVDGITRSLALEWVRLFDFHIGEEMSKTLEDEVDDDDAPWKDQTMLL